MKARFLLILLLLPCLMLAQEVDRVTINGVITAPEGDDVEGVNVYNSSSQRGTVTDADGTFTLDVAENDRVQITALQFQSFTVIVDKGVLDAKQMAIYLNPAVNVLEEVIVRPYDLSGNIRADVARIKTVDLDTEWALDYENLEFEYGFIVDAQTSIRGNKAEEAYYNGQKPYGGNILGLIGLLLPKKKKRDSSANAQELLLYNALRQRFSNAYIVETFNIAPSQANDFIYFAEESGVRASMLRAENELELLAFMSEKAEAYKQRRAKQ